mmetsp:Transcript_5859/g.12213  ORF Transcript_5859/g.12213 Transcript_5859/m.12213 type:complete len:282 (+) Transcript_5859:18-863(+)
MAVPLPGSATEAHTQTHGCAPSGPRRPGRGRGATWATNAITCLLGPHLLGVFKTFSRCSVRQLSKQLPLPLTMKACLLHRDRFCQVPGLVDVASSVLGDVVGQQLEWNDREQRVQGGVGELDAHHHLRQPVKIVVAHVRDDNQSPLSRVHLLHVGLHLVVLGVRARRHDHHRHETVNQGDGAVLHLRRWVALGVDVGDLLQLQGALQGHRKIQPAPEEQAVLGQAVVPALFADLRALLQDLGHLVGHVVQGRTDGLEVRGGDAVPLLADEQGKHGQDDHLG